jgi:integrase
MANLGLRIGEVVKIKLEDIDIPKRKLLLLTEKARTRDSLYLHDDVADKLTNWINLHYELIQQHDCHILFSVNQSGDRSHVSPNWLRNEFRTAIILAGLNEWYGKTDESDSSRKARRLHRLTTHSLRHYFITKVYKATKDPVIASKLARHTDLKSTQVYIHSAQQDLDVSMSSVFEKSYVEQQKEKEDLKKLMEIWRAIR